MRALAATRPLLLMATLSCGGTRKATIPVDSPLRPFDPAQAEAPAAASPDTPQQATPAPPAAPPAN